MSELYIGIMSGTSLDGIDISIVDFHDNLTTSIFSNTYRFSLGLQEQLQKLIIKPEVSLSRLGQIQHQLAIAYADAVKLALQSANKKATEIIAIGCHGQTVFHDPIGDYPYSMQLGSGAILSELTGIKVVTDFRNNDIALGGQGAPLVCGFHASLVNSENAVLINLGGIANVTLINNSKIIGFDTGPANCLLDNWYQQERSGQYDVDGEWAASGQVNTELLKVMLSDAYFSQAAPKSTGREYFNLAWLRNKIKQLKVKSSSEDVQATLIELTSRSICDALPESLPKDIFVFGGGIHNKMLMASIKNQLTSRIKTTEALGIAPDFMEAITFAWLAKKRINHQKGVISSVTGAEIDAMAGCVYLPSR